MEPHRGVLPAPAVQLAIFGEPAGKHAGKIHNGAGEENAFLAARGSGAG